MNYHHLGRHYYYSEAPSLLRRSILPARVTCSISHWSLHKSDELELKQSAKVEADRSTKAIPLGPIRASISTVLVADSKDL